MMTKEHPTIRMLLLLCVLTNKFMFFCVIWKTIAKIANIPLRGIVSHHISPIF